VRTTQALTLAAAVLASGCSHQQLRRTGDRMIRVERGAEGLVEQVVEFKDARIADCRAQDLLTAEDREACVEPAVKLVEGTEAATQALRAALVTFWEVYPVLEAKLLNREKITADDLADLAARASRVASEYAALVDMIRAAREGEKP